MADRIALNADAWDTRPQRITTGGQHVVRLDWSGAWDAHTIRLTGRDPSHLDLLVIPPDTATVLALTCLAIARRCRICPPSPRADPFPIGTPVGAAGWGGRGERSGSRPAAGRPTAGVSGS
jgi:hypothetical protein